MSSNSVGDGTDDDACVLLDHIPHNDCCNPDYNDPTTYTPYAISIIIPNIICEHCSLHLSNPMTDKIGDDGSPLGIGCTDPGSCFSVYHSCTKSFRIVGDANDGAVQRSDFVCPSLNKVNVGWPSVWIGDNGEAVDASIPGVYRRESSIWSQNNSTLTTAPWQFRVGGGEFCVALRLASISNIYCKTNNDSYLCYSPNTIFQAHVTLNLLQSRRMRIRVFRLHYHRPWQN